MRFASAYYSNPDDVRTLDLNDPFVKTFRNPLDDFRTYSYIHIVAVCTTVDIPKIDRLFTDPVQVTQLLNTPTPKMPNGNRIMQTSPMGGKYAIILNGAQDVDYVLDNITTRMVGAGVPQGIGSEALVSMGGEMVITEPHGVKFMFMLRELCGVFGVNSAGLNLVVKTIYVGHPHGEPTDTIKTLCDYPPFYATIDTFQIASTEQGSIYTIGFINNVSGIGQHPAISSGAGGVQLKNNGSVREGLNQIARQYTEGSYQNAARIQTTDKKIPVQYKIKLHPDIAYAGDWVTTDGANIRAKGLNGSQQLAVPANVAIEGAITFVFEHCKQYLDQSADRSNQKSFIFKVSSSMIEAENEATVTYLIEPIYLNVHPTLNSRISAAQASSTIDIAKTLNKDDPVLIYDYVFTGRNTDIESFDMIIRDGQYFLQSITTSQNVSETYSTVEQRVGGVVMASTSQQYIKNKPGTRVVVGQAAQDEQLRSANSELSASKTKYDQVYNTTWSTEAAKMSAILKTRGHPGWFSRFCVNPYTIAGNEPPAMLNDMPYVYLNILMPQTWAGSVPAREAAGVPMAFEKFWYQGVWRVLNITSSFADGVFSTELEIIGHPLGEGFGGTAVATVDKQEAANVPPGTDVKRDTPTTSTRDSEEGTTADTHAPIPNGTFLLASTDNTTQLTADFTLGHFTRTSYAGPGENQPQTQTQLDNIVRMAKLMQRIKDALKIEIRINSGYRSPEVNARVGGAGKSDHLTGSAVDFSTKNMSIKDLFDTVAGLGIEYHQLIWEVYSTQWVHISLRESGNAHQKFKINHGKVEQV